MAPRLFDPGFPIMSKRYGIIVAVFALIGLSATGLWLASSVQKAEESLIQRRYAEAVKHLEAALAEWVEDQGRNAFMEISVPDAALRLVQATNPKLDASPDEVRRFVRYGSSPRGAQTLALAAKVRAILEGRYNVSFEDVRRVFLPAMRHRVLLNFEAQAEGIDPDQVLLDILEKVPEKAD